MAKAFIMCLIWMCVWQQDTRTHSLCKFTSVCTYVYSQHSIFFIDGFKKTLPSRLYTLVYMYILFDMLSSLLLCHWVYTACMESWLQLLQMLFISSVLQPLVYRSLSNRPHIISSVCHGRQKKHWGVCRFKGTGKNIATSCLHPHLKCQCKYVTS